MTMHPVEIERPKRRGFEISHRWTLVAFIGLASAGPGCAAKQARPAPPEQPAIVPGPEEMGNSSLMTQSAPQATGRGAKVPTIATGLGLPRPGAPEAITLWSPGRPGSARVVDRVDIDLRTVAGIARLPPIGLQSHQDCVAWAGGYSMRSFLRARDTDRAPDADARIFSPTFIYNQINGGVDAGSSLIDALELMKNHGAATLDVLPYARTEYTTKPSPEVLRAAAAWKITAYERIVDPRDIPTALAQGLPVLVHAYLDNEFRSGKHPVYNQRLRERSAATSERSDPYANDRHAMLIIGYNADPCEYLLVNSWGADWGQSGYTRVSCDVVSAIRLDDGQTFLQEAYVVTGTVKPPSSEARPPTPTPTPPQPLPPTEFTLVQSSLPRPNQAAESWYWRLEIVEKTSTGQMELHSASLDAQPGCWRSPGRYECHLKGDADRRSFTVEVRDRSGRGVRTETVIVRIDRPVDGGVQPVPSKLALTNRALRLQPRPGDTTEHFVWTVYLEGSAAELARVRSVDYRLHSTFPKRVVRVVEDGPQGFPLSANGWGEFKVRATVNFLDGSRQKLEHCLELGFETSICN